MHFLEAYEELVDVYYKKVLPTLCNSPMEDWGEIIIFIKNLSLSEKYKDELIKSELVQNIWKEIDERDDELYNGNLYE